MTMHRRLSDVSLDTAISDPSDRNYMAMSTLKSIDSDPPNEQWLLETSWDGDAIGDVQVFRNLSVGHNGLRMLDKANKPLPDSWVWWGGVPRGKVKSYRFAVREEIKPQTVKDAEREAKPGQARQERAPSA
jgi:hypothetical protein